MKYFFYDTCSLITQGKDVFYKIKKFYISSITLKELQNIKTSNYKDQSIKYKARKVLKNLVQNQDKYEVINYQKDWDILLNNYPVLSDNNDSKIILTAIQLQKELGIDLIFVTQDLACKHIAAAAGLQTLYLEEKESSYKGYITVPYSTDEELAELYEKIYSYDNYFNLVQNQYLLIKDPNNNIIDRYKKSHNELKRVPDFISFDSKMFGKVKPKDQYQLIAMDSLLSNKITMIKGAAGTGKSYLSIACLFNMLEHNKIDKIIIFCNTVATNGSAKLGYYPGSKDQKLLDSQIGNFLASKLGDREAVLEYIEKGLIVLLPMSDIRGFDTSGMKAGIYITQAQNMDIELIRLALQRVGEDSICILDGDSDAQVDLNLYAGNNNGMKRVSEVFRGENIYGEVCLPNIYRSRIAQIAQRL